MFQVKQPKITFAYKRETRASVSINNKRVINTVTAAYLLCNNGWVELGPNLIKFLVDMLNHAHKSTIVCTTCLTCYYLQMNHASNLWWHKDCKHNNNIFQRFSRAGPRGKTREWATLGVHPLSWLLSNNRLEEVCGTLTKGTFSSRLLLSNQDKGCTPSVAHSLPLPLQLPPGFCSTCQILAWGKIQSVVSNYRFHVVCLVWFGHGFINCLASDLLLCHFHKELTIWEKMSLVFCQTDNPWFSFIMYMIFAIEEFNLFIHVENLLDEMLVNLVSYVSQQGGSPW